MSTQPHLLATPDEIHPTALVPGDPDRVDRIAEHCSEVTDVASNREYRVVTATYDGIPLTLCSTGIGSPSAAIAVEELVNLGVTTFIRVGTAGALQPGIDVGDLVVATGAAKDEGTTKRYESATIPAVPAYRVLAALVEATGAIDHPVHTGPIVTDDAFYAETEEYVQDWEAAGLLAVEMEAASLFSVARRHGCAAGAICTIDGNLVAGTQKGASVDETELPEGARDAVGVAISAALDAAASLGATSQ